MEGRPPPPPPEDEFGDIDPRYKEDPAYQPRERDPTTGERILPQQPSTVGGSDTGERPATRERPPTGERPITSERPLPGGPPGERPPPGGRRHRRRRELPAKVRRRQAIGAGLVVVGAVAAGVLLLTGRGGDDKPAPPEVSELPVSKLIGQTVVGRLPGSGPSKEMLKRVRKGQLGGVIVFPRNEESLRADIRKLQKVAAKGGNPPLIVAIDQEGGKVKRLPGPPTQSPAELGAGGSTDAARMQGEQTGRYLSGAGVNVNLAPDADISHPEAPDTIRERTFGEDPGRVSELAIAFAEGMESNGVAATFKHFPGLGLTTQNTDTKAATIPAPRPDLENEMVPFAEAIEAGAAPLVMLSTAIYPALGSGDPAAWAPPVVTGELRERLGFDGIAITDDLEGQAVRSELSPDRAAARALAAGVDIVLFAKGVGTSADAYESLVRQAGKGGVPRPALESAYERILELKESFPSRAG